MNETESPLMLGISAIITPKMPKMMEKAWTKISGVSPDDIFLAAALEISKRGFRVSCGKPDTNATHKIHPVAGSRSRV